MNKKMLSLTLALVMILGSLTAVFASETDAANFLEKEEILVGIKDEAGKVNLKLEDNLARRDSFVLLARLMGEEAEDLEVEEGYPTFVDKGGDTFYLDVYGWAEENGYVEGTDENKVEGMRDVKAREYALVLMRALGYDLKGTEAWNEIEKIATDKGLLEGLEVEKDDAVTRGQVAQMTFNALGVNVKGTDQTLAEKLGIEMPVAKELTAEVNETENLREVVLELSNAKLVDAEKLENEDNYRVDKFKVVRATVDGDNVILELDKTLVKNRSYDLTVRNIDKAINKKYSFKANDNASPKVEKVEALGEYGIKVTLSEPVEKPLEKNFLVDGKNISMNVEEYGRVLILTPYHKTAFSTNAEKLTIKELEDYAGYKSALEDFEIEIVKDEVAPKVLDAVVKGNIVEVTFDKDVYADSVEGYQNRKDEGNISYRDGRNTIFTIQATTNKEYGNKIDTNKVSYEFKDNLPRGTEVTIVDVQNHSKVAMEKTTIGVREVKDNIEPEIIDVDVAKRLADNEATITLEFDKPVYGFEINSNTEFDVAKHFTLYTEEVLKRNIVDGAKGKVVSAKYDGTDKTKIVVELENLQKNNDDKDYDYILEVVDFEDGSRNRMFRDYVEFELKEGKTLVVEDIVIKEDTKADETVVTIDFNYAVDRARAEDGTNYEFRTKLGNKPKDAKELDGDIRVINNGKTVTITLPEFKYDDYKANGLFEITTALRDKDGNKLANKVVYKFETVYKDVVAAEKLDYIIVKETNGEYTVTPKTGVTAMTLKTDVEGTFNVVSNGLTKLVIDAPKGHVTLNGVDAANPAHVGIVEIINIAPNSLVIGEFAKVDKIVVETDKAFNITTVKAGDFILTSTGKDNDKVKVNGTPVTVEKGKDVEVKVDEDGKLETETEAGKEEKAKLEKATEEVSKLGRLKDVTNADKDPVQDLVTALKDSEEKVTLQKELDKIKTVEDKQEEENKDKLGKLTFKIKGIKTENAQREITYAELDTVVSKNAKAMLDALIKDDSLTLEDDVYKEIWDDLLKIEFDKSKIVINAEGEIEVEDGFLVTGWEVLKDIRLKADPKTGYNVTLIDGDTEYRITISNDGSSTITAKQ